MTVSSELLLIRTPISATQTSASGFQNTLESLNLYAASNTGGTYEFWESWNSQKPQESIWEHGEMCGVHSVLSVQRNSRH